MSRVVNGEARVSTEAVEKVRG
ncbi:hypothetical protein [Streptomyces sp. NPDC052015]